jgi:hypothetical protein
MGMKLDLSLVMFEKNVLKRVFGLKGEELKE